MDHMHQYAIICCSRLKKETSWSSWPLWTWEVGMDKTFASFCALPRRSVGTCAGAWTDHKTRRVIKVTMWNIEQDKHASYHASMLRDRDIEVGAGRERERERERGRERERATRPTRAKMSNDVWASLCVYWQCSWKLQLSIWLCIHWPVRCLCSVYWEETTKQRIGLPTGKAKVVCNSARTIWTSAVCVNASLHICTNYYRLCLSSTPRRSSKSLASACPGHHTSRTSKIEQTPAASLISGDLICIPRLSLNTGTVLWYPSSVDKITVQSIVALPWSGQLNRCEVWCIVQIPFAYGSFSRRWLRGGWHVNVLQYM